MHRHESKAPPSAFNPRANRVHWNEDWPRFRPAEYVATGIAGVGVFAALLIPTAPERWTEIGSFDTAARDALRLPTAGTRRTAHDASDLVLGLMINQLILDATLVAWLGHDRPSVGYQLLLMDMEALAFTGALQAIVSSLASRRRPYRDTCVGPIESQSRDCRSRKEFSSFFSGHTSGAFTAAGLMCMHHAYLPLYGGGAREALTCAGAVAAAATVGMLRVVADQHFASDALVGAAIGTLSGLGLPWLLHYRGGAAPPARTGSARRGSDFSLRLLPSPTGLTASGEF